MDVFSELQDIGRMLASASVLVVVRQEVARVMSGAVVTDGSHQEGCADYDVVVRCGADGDLVARRLREKLPDADVIRIAEGVVGLREPRRLTDGQ